MSQGAQSRGFEPPRLSVCGKIPLSMCTSSPVLPKPATVLCLALACANEEMAGRKQFLVGHAKTL